MTKAYTRGSIVGFVLVGVTLAAVVIGGIYVVKNQLDGRLGGASIEETARDVATTVGDATEEATSDEESDAQERADQEAADAERERVESQTYEEQVTSDDEATTDETTDTATTNETNETREEDLPTAGVELPQTGIGDALLTMLPVAAVVGAVMAYRRSNLP